MNYNAIISGVAFAVIFLAAVFLFIRNYPSDRLFSVVFIVAGGVLALCAAGATGAVAGNVNKIERPIDKPCTTIDDPPNEPDEHGSIAGQEQEGTEGRSERMGDDKGE
jgi:hypothetical protein